MCRSACQQAEKANCVRLPVFRYITPQQGTRHHNACPYLIQWVGALTALTSALVSVKIPSRNAYWRSSLCRLFTTACKVRWVSISPKSILRRKLDFRFYLYELTMSCVIFFTMIDRLLVPLSVAQSQAKGIALLGR